MVTYADITRADGVNFILEWQHGEDGTDYLTLTEACSEPVENDGEEEDCENTHETYDFMQTDDGKTANKEMK